MKSEHRGDLGIEMTITTSTSNVTKSADTFFFQAEDGIRDTSVTGVQTCALPISALADLSARREAFSAPVASRQS